jgi:hypothetical protein
VTRVALDLIPDAARPTEVARLLDEALALRARHREANEALAKAQADLERAEAADVAAAAERIRSGEAPGKLSASISTARHAVETAQRNAAALDLAARAAGDDLAATMREHADTWLVALDEAREQARARARDALDALVVATGALREAASTAAWLRSGLSDDRWDRQPPVMVVGSAAPSSRRTTANQEPLHVDALVGYLREAIEPPSLASSIPPRSGALPAETTRR